MFHALLPPIICPSLSLSVPRIKHGHELEVPLWCDQWSASLLATTFLSPHLTSCDARCLSPGKEVREELSQRSLLWPSPQQISPHPLGWSSFRFSWYIPYFPVSPVDSKFLSETLPFNLPFNLQFLTQYHEFFVVGRKEGSHDLSQNWAFAHHLSVCFQVSFPENLICLLSFTKFFLISSISCQVIPADVFHFSYIFNWASQETQG